MKDDRRESPITVNESIQNLKVEDMVNRLSNTTHGLHCLIIYSDLVTLREFYTCYIKAQIENKNKMVLFNPFYETISSVRRSFSNSHKAIDVNKYENTETLIINDSLNEYFGGTNSFNSKIKLLEFANRSGKEGLSVIADMGSYFFKMDYDKLVDYELSLPLYFDMPLTGLCLYHKKDFSRLSEEQRQMLVSNHAMTLKLESH